MFSKSCPEFNIFRLINYGMKIYTYTNYYEWWHHDINLVISFLWAHIRGLLLSGTTRNFLYLHADNCARDNKNRFMFGFLCFLVKKQNFNVIEFHFLSAGNLFMYFYFNFYSFIID